jgi:hypothetical protein
MLTYEQSTGRLLNSAGTPLGVGYAGAGDGKNQPDQQQVENVGPIPVGVYDVGPPHDTAAHGPFVLTLTPHPGNEMFGRAGFLIHGDSVANPGTASQGCIIQARSAREAAWQDCQTNQAALTVIRG